jgi:hypothetical protein
MRPWELKRRHHADVLVSEGTMLEAGPMVHAPAEPEDRATQAPYPRPPFSSEELAQQLASDPEFMDWAAAEQRAEWAARGPRR